MTITWMMHGAVIGASIVVTALALEQMARLLGRPTRWVWLAALAASMVLIAVAPLRPRPVVTPTTAAADLGATLGVSTTAPAAIPVNSAGIARSAIAGPARLANAIAEWRAPRAANVVVGAAWATASVALLVLFALVQWRFRRARNGWPLVELHGTPARIAPDVGPAVIGFRPPEIVVPRWLLLRGAEEQRLVLAHEREHLLAGDPFTLGAGWLAITLMPWNPAMWYMASRLRLAIEIDCDRRTLRHGVRPRVYGDLLIDLAAQCSGMTIGAAAFAERPTQLEQRLIAMQPKPRRFSAVRAVGCTAIGVSALTAASAVRMPVPADVGLHARPAVHSEVAMQALVAPATVPRSLGQSPSAVLTPNATAPDRARLALAKARFAGEAAILVQGESTRPTQWFVDDVPVSPDSAKAALTAARRIMRFQSPRADAPAEIHIYTMETPAGSEQPRSVIASARADTATGGTIARIAHEQEVETFRVGFVRGAIGPEEAEVIKVRLANLHDSAERGAAVIEMLQKMQAGALGDDVMWTRPAPGTADTASGTYRVEIRRSTTPGGRMLIRPEPASSESTP